MGEETIAERKLRRPLWRIGVFLAGAVIVLMTGIRDYAWFHSAMPATPVGILKTIFGPLLGLAFALGAVLARPPAGADSRNRDLRQSDEGPNL
jgi:hypothetical protein